MTTTPRVRNGSDSNARAVDDVRSYYDQNTARFERFGQGRGTGAIHRSVRAEPGDEDPSPFRTLERVVLKELAALDSTLEKVHVLDLGCGVGASMIYLASHAPVAVTGITLSGLQAARAEERIASSGLGARVRCLQGSYLDIPESVPVAALAYSIEAFIHGPDPARFFAAAARHIAPGGRLLVFDDFLGPRAEGTLARNEERVLRDVREGWLANTLLTPARANELAGLAGFENVRNDNLTARLELDRPRDRAIRALVAIGRHLPLNGYRFRALLGGDALQRALKSGLIEFRCLGWRRAGG